MSLSAQLREYVAACFTGIWIESHEHPDALAEIARLCRDEQWRLTTWNPTHENAAAPQPAAHSTLGGATIKTPAARATDSPFVGKGDPGARPAAGKTAAGPQIVPEPVRSREMSPEKTSPYEQAQAWKGIRDEALVRRANLGVIKSSPPAETSSPSEPRAGESQ